MCSSPHWQVGSSWFRQKLSPANRNKGYRGKQISRRNCLPRIECKELPRFREKYHALGRHVCKIREIGGQKMGSNMRPRYIQFRDIHDRDILGLHCTRTRMFSTRPSPVCKVIQPWLWKWYPLCNVFSLTWDPIWLNSVGNHEAAAGILRTQAF